MNLVLGGLASLAGSALHRFHPAGTRGLDAHQWVGALAGAALAALGVAYMPRRRSLLLRRTTIVLGFVVLAAVAVGTYDLLTGGLEPGPDAGLAITAWGGVAALISELPAAVRERQLVTRRGRRSHR